MATRYVTDLWHSKAEDIVRESYQRAVANSERDRMGNMRHRLAIWRDAHLYQLQSRATQIYSAESGIASEITPLLRVYPNVLKRVVKRLSTVYSRRPRRWLDGDAARAYPAFLRSLPFSLDERMCAANPMVNLCNVVLLRYARNDLPPSGDGLPVLEVITPDRFTVVTHPDDCTRPVIVLYSRVSPAAVSGRPPWAVDGPPLQWVYWDPDGYVVLDATGRVVSRGDNTLRDPATGDGVLPFVAVHRELPMDTFFDDVSGSDLVQATLDVGVHLAGLYRLFQWQSENQVVIKSGDKKPPKRQMLGASSAVVLDADGDFQVVPNQADPGKIVEMIRFRMRDVAAAYGLPADALELTIKGSAAEMRLLEAPLLERRVEQLPRWLDAERRLYRLMALSHPEAGLDPGAPLNVNFSDQPLVVDPSEATDLAVKRIQAGFSSVEEEMMRQDPDLDPESAREKFDEIIESRTRYNRALVTSNAPLDPTKPSMSPQDNGARGTAARDGTPVEFASE